MPELDACPLARFPDLAAAAAERRARALNEIEGAVEVDRSFRRTVPDAALYRVASSHSFEFITDRALFSVPSHPFGVAPPIWDIGPRGMSRPGPSPDFGRVVRRQTRGDRGHGQDPTEGPVILELPCTPGLQEALALAPFEPSHPVALICEDGRLALRAERPLSPDEWDVVRVEFEEYVLDYNRAAKAAEDALVGALSDWKARYESAASTVRSQHADRWKAAYERFLHERTRAAEHVTAALRRWYEEETHRVAVVEEPEQTVLNGRRALEELRREVEALSPPDAVDEIAADEQLWTYEGVVTPHEIAGGNGARQSNVAALLVAAYRERMVPVLARSAGALCGVLRRYGYRVPTFERIRGLEGGWTHPRAPRFEIESDRRKAREGQLGRLLSGQHSPPESSLSESILKPVANALSEVIDVEVASLVAERGWLAEQAEVKRREDQSAAQSMWDQTSGEGPASPTGA